jgi:hypothetical protein
LQFQDTVCHRQATSNTNTIPVGRDASDGGAIDLVGDTLIAAADAFRVIAGRASNRIAHNIGSTLAFAVVFRAQRLGALGVLRVRHDDAIAGRWQAERRRIAARLAAVAVRIDLARRLAQRRLVVRHALVAAVDLLDVLVVFALERDGEARHFGARIALVLAALGAGTRRAVGQRLGRAAGTRRRAGRRRSAARQTAFAVRSDLVRRYAFRLCHALRCTAAALWFDRTKAGLTLDLRALDAGTVVCYVRGV